jgi:hypothetical protein
MARYVLLLSLLFTNPFILFSQVSEIFFESDTSDFKNPERGFYWHTEVHTGDDERWGNHPYFENISKSADKAIEQNLSLVLRVYYLDQYYSKSLDDKFLSFLEDDFSTVREKGLKIILRFAYKRFVDTNEKGEIVPPLNDANEEMVHIHLRQLKPILSENSDIILAIQAGFRGIWGEWALSDSFKSTNSRNSLIDAILDNTPANRMVQLRMPRLKWDFKGNKDNISPYDAFSRSKIARLGFHNDCFLAGTDDFGTYTNPVDKSKKYLSDETNWVIMGGETCSLNPHRTQCENTLNELEEQHWTYLNLLYRPEVIDGWKSENCISTISKNLGYRYKLISSDFSFSTRNSFKIGIELINEGFAPLYNERNLELVFRHIQSGEEYSVILDEDPRYWPPNEKVKVSGEFGFRDYLPMGFYDVFLNMPDYSLELRNNPAYSIRFANLNTFEHETGYNKILSDIELDANSSDAVKLNQNDIYSGTNWLFHTDSIGYFHNLKDKSKHRGEIVAYPNPLGLNQELQVKFKVSTELILRFVFLDIHGIMISDKQYITKPGTNVISFESWMLPNKRGIYYMKILDKTSVVSTQKILIY